MSVFIRLLGVFLLVLSALLYIKQVEGSEGYLFRNSLPIFLVFVLTAIALLKPENRVRREKAWQWLLGTAGYTIPALGLSLYLHYAYAVNLNGMFTESRQPIELFRYLPLYTLFAGAIGFAIGWIIGRNFKSKD